MGFKITILGSGTAVPQLSRSASAVLIESGDLILLVDLGPGTIRRLLEYGIPVGDISHLFFSHFHPDHTADLVPLLFAAKYAGSHLHLRQLSLHAGEGFNRFYQGLQAAYEDWIVLPAHQMAIHEIDTSAGETFSIGDVTITARPVAHRPESLAFRFKNSAGTAIVYSGDTDRCEALADLARDADLFICEAAHPDGMKTEGHLTPSLAGGIARKASAKRLVLTHLYPPCDEVDIAKQAAGAYKGPVIVAEDLMSFVFE